MDNGRAIFLSPKCYLLEDESTQKSKKALKGVNCETDIQFQHFVDVLYNNSKIHRQQNRLRRNQKHYAMELQSNMKKSLNSVYYKMKVSNDFVKCSPLTNGSGEYM